MKLARNVVAPAIVLGLCVGLAGACGPKKPPGTNPPGETGSGGGGTATTDGGGSDDGGSGTTSDGGAVANGDGGGDGGAAPADCAAKVSDTPTLLFSDKVIFRTPPGVEFIPDGNPTFQQATMGGGGFMSTCDALIKRVMISLYETDKKKKPIKVIDEMIEALAQQGYANGKKSGAHVESATDVHVSVEYGGGGGSQAVVLYIALARRGDTDFIVIYESTPDDFKMLKATFEESAKSLFIVPD